MVKILIVDDNQKRLDQLKCTLLSDFSINKNQIDTALSINSGKRLLKQINYTIVFLDMALPQYDLEPNVDEWGGIRILREITRNSLCKPDRVIGYTAIDEGLKEKETEFNDIGFSLHYSPVGDMSWMKSIKSQIVYAMELGSSQRKSEKDIAILTVHGIRTFGSWQERLYSLFQNNSSDKDIVHLSFKFTGIDFFTFIIPPLREKIINRLYNDLTVWLENNKAKNIICFSHSFGTYITIKALEKFQSKNDLKPISKIILSGSVLDKDYDFSNLQSKTSSLIINDCAIHDLPLIFSEAFVIGTGMAGKTGFRGLSSNGVLNRFYDGGHSVFFDKDNNFMSEYWLPLASGDAVSDISKDKQYNLAHEILVLVSRFSSNFKQYYPILILLFFIYIIIY
ncbi:hypothetical protein [Photobacterium damselae]|uniref:hypothetical protein n=1 Tax=Photobacterium damselae TaxID=38293 RepID=UPI0029D7DAE6|nr:hypothetical protein [Photobacterium damselae]